MNKKIEFMYCFDLSNPYTFRAKKLKRFVEKHSHGRVLNLFSGKTILQLNEFRVDVDKTVNPDFCGDAMDFLKNHCKEKFDTVILDPPFNKRKSMEKYNGRYFSSFRIIQDELLKHLNEFATVITLGFNTCGMSRKRGFEKIAIAIINHGGSANDTLCVVENKLSSLNYFVKQKMSEEKPIKEKA